MCERDSVERKYSSDGTFRHFFRALVLTGQIRMNFRARPHLYYFSGECIGLTSKAAQVRPIDEVSVAACCQRVLG